MLPDPLEMLRKDLVRVQAVLPRWTATHPWKYHWIAYGHEGEILDDDDSDWERA